MNPNEDVTEIPFMAGLNEDGEPVFEALQIEIVDAEDQQVRLLKSPLLSRNLAAGDRIKLINPAAGEFEMVQRSGNLAIRIFRRHQLAALADRLTPAMEKADGRLDLQSDRALVYSIHFSIGFQTIEEVLNEVCKDYPDTVWYYGNVYDPEDGSTPLGWWLEFDNE